VKTIERIAVSIRDRLAKREDVIGHSLMGIKSIRQHEERNNLSYYTCNLFHGWMKSKSFAGDSIE
jgi:hypothetical protein